MSFVDTNTDDWNNYIGPNGVPRIDVTPKQQLKEYEDLKYYADKLPVQGQAAPTTYIMEPDLVETQTGKVHTPPDVSFDDAGFAYNNVTGEPVQIIRRPNVLPIARTPDGYTFAMPKILDAASNIVGGVAAPAVATKAGEVVLGSGAVKTAMEAAPKYPLAAATDRWTNTLGQNDHLMQTMSPDEFLKQSRPLKIDTESRETIDALKQKMQAGEPLDPLELHTNGKEDGRHRAIAAKELGINEVPVLNFRQPTGPFYSGLERAVDAAKVNKADASQWLGYLKNQPGVKADEIGQVLKDLPQGPITKEQLQNIVQQNKVQLGEVVKGKGIKGEPLTPDDAGYDPYRIQTNSQTKYHDYQLPGGENYQEMLLTLPYKEPKFGVYNGDYQVLPKEFNTAAEAREAAIAMGLKGKASIREIDTPQSAFTSSHWDEPNILAHVRYNDRNIPDVGKSLHLEEIQSDWHQAGRKQGYKGESNLDKFNELDKQLQEARADLGQAAIDSSQNSIGMSWAKFLQTKPTQEAKDAALAKIAEYRKTDSRYLDREAKVKELEDARARANPAGKVPDAPFKKTWDELAFKRMLHKAATEGYDSISWTPGEAQAARYDLSKHLDSVGYQKRGENTYNITAWGKNGGSVWSNQSATPEMIEQHLGKEMADKIIKGAGRKEGNHTYLEDLDLKVGGEGMKSFYDKMLVDKANALAKKYGAKVETKNLKPKIDESVGYENHLELKYGSNYKNQMTTEETKILNDLKNIKGQPVHVLKLTPELRAKAKEGFPMFSFTPTLSPVQHNPWADDQKKYKLTPVQGNPFND